MTDLGTCKRIYQELSRTDPEEVIRFDLLLNEWSGLAEPVLRTCQESGLRSATYAAVSDAFQIGFIRGIEYQTEKERRKGSSAEGKTT